MNLTALQTFLAIVETGSLVRASQRLNVTQSTVTTRLKGLEEELGQTLLNRHKSGATLTAPGLKLKRYAQVMTELWRQARQETSLPEGIEAVCNIGCHMDLWPGLGANLFEVIGRDHPAVALSVWPGDQARQEEWLATGLVDMALTYHPTTQTNQTAHPVRADNLVLVSTRADSPVRFDLGYIYVDAGEEFGRQHAAAYSDGNTAQISFGCAVWGLEYLLKHGGSGYLPERLAADPLAAGKLYLIGDAPVFTRKTYLITNDTATTPWPWLPDVIAEIGDLRSSEGQSL